MYKIFETETFLKSMEKDFSGRKEKIRDKLKSYVYPQLAQSPEFGKNIKKLKGWEPPAWRYRIGPYRFFYEIDRQEKIVFMLLADHRGKGYK